MPLALMTMTNPRNDNMITGFNVEFFLVGVEQYCKASPQQGVILQLAHDLAMLGVLLQKLGLSLFLFDLIFGKEIGRAHV